MYINFSMNDEVLMDQQPGAALLLWPMSMHDYHPSVKTSVTIAFSCVAKQGTADITGS